MNSQRLGELTIAKTVCRHAVKANDPLNGPELENLVNDLRHCAMPYTCPHGRPTLIEMSYTELEKNVWAHRRIALRGSVGAFGLPRNAPRSDAQDARRPDGRATSSMRASAGENRAPFVDDLLIHLATPPRFSSSCKNFCGAIWWIAHQGDARVHLMLFRADAFLLPNFVKKKSESSAVPGRCPSRRYRISSFFDSMISLGTTAAGWFSFTIHTPRADFELKRGLSTSNWTFRSALDQLVSNASLWRR